MKLPADYLHCGCKDHEEGGVLRLRVTTHRRSDDRCVRSVGGLMPEDPTEHPPYEASEQDHDLPRDFL